MDQGAGAAGDADAAGLECLEGGNRREQQMA